MPAPKSPEILELDRICEQYVKPVEHEHAGEYALVMADGQVFFGPDIVELADKAMENPGRKNHFLKVKESAVYKIL